MFRGKYSDASFNYRYFGIEHRMWWSSYNGAPKTFKNELEAFKYIWNKTSTVKTFPELWTKLEKLNDAAEEVKVMGNYCYESKEYDKAGKCYLKALSAAKYKGLTYGKILSNLALVRYANGKYHQCIELINMCEKTEYPKNNFPKLYIRKMRAWKKLGDDRNALETFDRLKKLLRTIKLGEKERKTFLDEANEALKEIPDKKLKKKGNKHLIIPEMEGKLTLKAEVRKGGVRGTIVQAREDIKLGEPILVEEMHVTNSLLLCSNCLLPNEVPHSCEKCMFVMYCSENCKKADAETHKLQCSLYQTMAFNEVVDFIYEPFILFTKGRTLNASYDFKAFLKDYETFFKTLVGCSIVVHYIIRNGQILKTLIDKKIVRSGLKETQMAYDIGQKLLKLAVILKFNKEPISDEYSIYSFFPEYSSFGHSCTPNTSKYLSGNNIIVKAAEDIEAGQEITVAHGNLLYSKHTHTERQEKLQKCYGFKCQCKACQNLYFEAELTGVIKCDRCGIYMRFEVGFIFCENCSSAKRLESEMRKIANLMNISRRTDLGRQELVEIVERFKMLEINPFNLVVVLTNLRLAKKDLEQGNVENAMKIVVTSNALKGPFNTHIYCLHSIFISLQTYLKTLHSSASRHRITEKISIEVMNNIEIFLDAFESLINLFYPMQEILEGIKEVRKYVSMIKQIYAIYNEADKLDWNILDEDDDLPKTVPLLSY